MKTRIAVNRHIVRENKKNGTDKPAVFARTYKGSRYGKRFRLTGTWDLIQDAEKPMCSGATVWLEGDSKDLEILA